MSHKTRHPMLTAVLFLGLIVTLSIAPLLNTNTSRAQGPDSPRKPIEETSSALPLPEGVTLSGEAGDEASVPAASFVPAFKRNEGPVNVIIVLDERPAVEAVLSTPGMSDAQAANVSRNQMARVEAAQQAVLGAMRSGGVDYQVLLSTKRVLSSITVRVDSSQLEAIKNLPGVKTAYVSRIGTLDNSTSVPFIGAIQAWGLGYTGEDMRVGIIDSGIDYLHADFGDITTGLPFAAFPNAKVAGGYDFVGNTWQPDPTEPGYDPVLAPDPDPMDLNGHGTHVAGTIAGYGVTTGNATFAGDWNGSTNVGALKIGSGVAPEATIYSYKIGAAGTRVDESAALASLDLAVDPNDDGDLSDHLDAVNMSVGGGFGDPVYGWSTAVNNTAQAGVVVVAAAGNAGDTYFNLDSPGAADWAIAVASSVDGSLGFEIQSPAGIAGTYLAASASFGPAAYDVTGSVVLVDDGSTAVPPDGTPPGTLTDGCNTPFANAAAVAGNIVMIDRGVCNFALKVANAQANGAIGVLIANSAAGSFGGLGGDDPTITIPSIMITYAEGQSIRNNLPVTVRMSETIVFGATADTLSTFSSRGPQRQPNGPDVGLKPDIAAPGDGITSAALGSVNGATVLSGTSMATPHVTGSTLLVIEEHPDWSVQEIKALLMSTATHDVYQNNNQTPPIYGPARRGTGRLDLRTATGSGIIAYNTANPELVSVSFGILDVTAADSWTKSITLENKSGSDASYTVGYTGIGDVNGVSYSVSPSSVTVPAGGSTTVDVTLTATDPNTWNGPHSRDSSVAATQLGIARHWLSEESGLVQFTSTSGTPDLWVAVYAAPRPASTLQAVENPLTLYGVSGTDYIDMTGSGIDTLGSFPYAEQSLVTPFELYYTSDDDPSSTGAANSADLQYVGVTTDYAEVIRRGGTLEANTRLFFGISTYGNWGTATAENTEFDISIDVDQDGVADYVIFNINIGWYAGTSATDSFIPVIADYVVGEYAWYSTYTNYYRASVADTVLYETNVMFLPVWADTIGLTASDAEFDWWITTYYNAGDGVLEDYTDVMTYDPTQQAIDFSGGYTGAPIWQDFAGPAVPIAWDWTQYVGPADPCVLLLHHHNAPGLRSEIVCLQQSVTTDLTVTKTVSDPNPDETDLIVYTITATNNDPDQAVNAVVQDVLPEGIAYISHTASQGTYDPATGEWDLGLLAAGGTATLEIRANPKIGTAGQTITNTATIEGSLEVSARVADADPSDNTASAAITVAGGAGTGTGESGATGAAGALGLADLSLFDPALSKIGVLPAGGLGLPGEKLTWTITLTNNGTATAYDVPLEDTIRPELRVDGADISKGSVVINGQTVSFTIPSIAPGETITAHIYTTVLSSPLDGVFTNEVFLKVGDTLLASAKAAVSGVGVLPSTGYEPKEEAGLNPWLIASAIAALAFVLTLGGALIRRRMNA